MCAACEKLPSSCLEKKKKKELTVLVIHGLQIIGITIIENLGPLK